MVLLYLFHGRHRPDEDLDDWGFDGPLLGPFEWVQTTYACHIKCPGPKNGDLFDLPIKDDLVEFAGCLYGDYTVYSVDDKQEWKETRLAKTKRVFEASDEDLPLLIEEYKDDPGLLAIIEKRLKGEKI